MKLDCGFCDHISKRPSEARRHRVVAHPSDEREFTCSLCGQVFSGTHSRRAHQMHVAAHELGVKQYWDKVIRPEDPDACWGWTGTKDYHGYGRVRWLGKMEKAYRRSYEINVGPIPAGLEIDHLCRNPECSNPRHLEPVTHAENVRRGMRDTRRKCLHCDLVTNAGNLARHAKFKHPEVAV